MSKLKIIILPLLTAVMFLSLYFAYTLNGSIPEGQLLPTVGGLFAYSLLLTNIISSTRVKKLERNVGLPALYFVHASMAITALLIAFMHTIIEFFADKTFATMPFSVPLGIVALVLLISVNVTGSLALSSIFSDKVAFLRKVKAKFLKRDFSLKLHRLSLVAVPLVFLHMVSFAFVRENVVLVALAASFLALAYLIYIGGKVRNKLLPKYTLTSVDKLNDTVWRLTFTPRSKKIITFTPGQYVFVRFIKAKLSSEAHPFSFTNIATASGEVQLIIKNSGDFTARLDELAVGDTATFEGPYGSFFTRQHKTAATPLVLLAGGVGITPILSILNDLSATSSTREITLVWGLSYARDTILVSELKALQQKLPNFKYHMLYSAEEVNAHHFGYISAEYLAAIKVDKYYKDATFMVCGPLPMMNAVDNILKSNSVTSKQISIERFSF